MGFFWGESDREENIENRKTMHTNDKGMHSKKRFSIDSL